MVKYRRWRDKVYEYLKDKDEPIDSREIIAQKFIEKRSPENVQSVVQNLLRDSRFEAVVPEVGRHQDMSVGSGDHRKILHWRVRDEYR